MTRNQDITVTAALLAHLPSSIQEGDDIPVEVEITWESNGYCAFGSDEGDAEVERVTFMDGDTPYDLTDQVEIEIDGETSEEARAEASEGYADYCYELMKGMRDDH